jgi:hypothetical protein
MENGTRISFFVYKFNIARILLLLLIQVKVLFSKYFDTINTATLNSNASFIDITDYHNIFPIITSNK